MKYRTEKEKRYEAVLNLYLEDVYKVCVYFTKDEKTAQDLAQRTFVEFYNWFEDVDPDCMYAYLIHIAKNLFLQMPKKSG